MKLFIAQFETETNTFAPMPTGWEGFREFGLRRGDGSLVEPAGIGCYLAEIRAMAEADGHEVVESVCTGAQPSGIIQRAVYETLRDQILEDLQAALPVDAVQLFLHGAMVADGYDDCEGDLVARIRAIVGAGVAIGVELDLHCHLTQRLCDAADVIVCFKEYPHTDIVDCARDVYRITMDTVAGRVRPTMGVYDCRMVGLWHTTSEPMLGFVKRMQSLEGRDGVLSVSFGHGFPWGDVPESGAKVWVITDNDQARADALAAELGAEIWAMRDATRPRYVAPDEAIDQALAISGRPVVLADVADNPGGGAPGDSTFILRRLVDRGVGNYALGCIWDLGAVQIACNAGEGARFPMRIGGKCGVTSGDPVDLIVTVKKILAEHSQYVWNMTWNLGRSVWLQTDDGGDIVLTSIRNQVLAREAFTALGIDLSSKTLIVVKSTQHFHSAFSPIAKEVIYVATPGAISPDFANIPYRHRDLNYWPRVDNPFQNEA